MRQFRGELAGQDDCGFAQGQCPVDRLVNCEWLWWPDSTLTLTLFVNAATRMTDTLLIASRLGPYFADSSWVAGGVGGRWAHVMTRVAAMSSGAFRIGEASALATGTQIIVMV